MMRSICILATLVVCATAASLREQPNENEQFSYDGYQVFKLHIEDEEDNHKVIELINESNEKYVIWKKYDETTKEIHIMVKPEEIPNFLKLLKENDIESEVMIRNLKVLIEKEEEDMISSECQADIGGTDPHNLCKIDDNLDDHPEEIESIEIRKSYEYVKRRDPYRNRPVPITRNKNPMN